jgi:hypothetical protein
MTLNITTFNISDRQHNHLLSHFKKNIMLIVVTLNVIVLSVVMLGVVRESVAAPCATIVAIFCRKGGIFFSKSFNRFCFL